MTSALQKIVLLFLVCSTLACQRKQGEQASVTIALPNVQKASTLSSCTVCLKFIAVNVSGDGIAPKIYAKREHSNFSETGTEITGEFELVVPTGPQRQFQIVAAYVDYSSGTEEIKIHYGSSIADLVNSSHTVEVSLEVLDTFKGGHIAGRYLNRLSGGPTGIVNINLIPKAGLGSFTLFKTSMVNGWFEFFASQNFEMSYEFADGTPIFSNIRLDRDYSAQSLAGNTQIVRVSRPSQYYRMESSSWVLQDDNETDFVAGFFFAPGVSNPLKKICKYDNTYSLNRMSQDNAGTNLISYSPTYTAANLSTHIQVAGGDTTCSFSSTSAQYTENRIWIHPEQFNGMGNDTAKSQQGAFTFYRDGTNIKKFLYAETATHDYTFYFLPDLLGASLTSIFDGIKIYTTATEPDHKDDISCNAEALSQLGYQPVPIQSATISGNAITVNLVNQLQNHVIVCPSRSGISPNYGGMYLGNVSSIGPAGPANLTLSDGPTYNFGQITIGSTPPQHTFVLTNTSSVGSADATVITITSPASPYTYTSDCGSTLSPLQTCNIEVQFNPTGSTPSNDTLTINYNDGTTSQNVSINLTGTGRTPALLAMTTLPLTFPNTTIGSNSQLTVTLTNTGETAANITPHGGTFSSSVFSFLGGAYPGTGGTCGTALSAGGGTCVLKLNFNPLSGGPASTALTIEYNNGVTGTDVTATMSGNGI